eukprot:451535_1
MWFFNLLLLVISNARIPLNSLRWDHVFKHQDTYWLMTPKLQLPHNPLCHQLSIRIKNEYDNTCLNHMNVTIGIATSVFTKPRNLNDQQHLATINITASKAAFMFEFHDITNDDAAIQKYMIHKFVKEYQKEINESKWIKLPDQQLSYLSFNKTQPVFYYVVMGIHNVKNIIGLCNVDINGFKDNFQDTRYLSNFQSSNLNRTVPSFAAFSTRTMYSHRIKIQDHNLKTGCDLGLLLRMPYKAFHQNIIWYFYRDDGTLVHCNSSAATYFKIDPQHNIFKIMVEKMRDRIELIIYSNYRFMDAKYGWRLHSIKYYYHRNIESIKWFQACIDTTTSSTTQIPWVYRINGGKNHVHVDGIFWLTITVYSQSHTQIGLIGNTNRVTNRFKDHYKLTSRHNIIGDEINNIMIRGKYNGSFKSCIKPGIRIIFFDQYQKQISNTFIVVSNGLKLMKDFQFNVEFWIQELDKTIHYNIAEANSHLFNQFIHYEQSPIFMVISMEVKEYGIPNDQIMYTIDHTKYSYKQMQIQKTTQKQSTCTTNVLSWKNVNNTNNISITKDIQSHVKTTDSAIPKVGCSHNIMMKFAATKSVPSKLYLTLSVLNAESMIIVQTSRYVQTEDTNHILYFTLKHVHLPNSPMLLITIFYTNLTHPTRKSTDWETITLQKTLTTFQPHQYPLLYNIETIIQNTNDTSQHNEHICNTWNISIDATHLEYLDNSADFGLTPYKLLWNPQIRHVNDPQWLQIDPMLNGTKKYKSIPILLPNIDESIIIQLRVDMHCRDTSLHEPLFQPSIFFDILDENNKADNRLRTQIPIVIEGVLNLYNIVVSVYGNPPRLLFQTFKGNAIDGTVVYSMDNLVAEIVFNAFDSEFVKLLQENNIKLHMFALNVFAHQKNLQNYWFLKLDYKVIDANYFMELLHKNSGGEILFWDLKNSKGKYFTRGLPVNYRSVTILSGTHKYEKPKIVSYWLPCKGTYKLQMDNPNAGATLKIKVYTIEKIFSMVHNSTDEDANIQFTFFDDMVVVQEDMGHKLVSSNVKGKLFQIIVTALFDDIESNIQLTLWRLNSDLLFY